MSKRRNDDIELTDPPSKRIRHDPISIDRLSLLSDELILRIFSFLAPADLNICQLISSKYHSIAGDSQLWKALYYQDFVRPRTPNAYGRKDATQRKLYSLKVLKHLQPESALWREHGTNWKNQYKLQHNWSRGSCEVREFQVAKERPIPPLLVCMHGKVVYTADSVTGLRAWSARKGRRSLGVMSLKDYSSPTSLGVDVDSVYAKEHGVVLGFKDGSFAVVVFDTMTGEFGTTYRHQPSSNGMLVGVGLCGSFLLTMTAAQLLSIYKFPSKAPLSKAPLLLHSLQSQSARSPLSCSIRRIGNVMNATIAYVFHGPFTWMVGVQEMRIDEESGNLISSRIAQSAPPSMTVYQPFMATRYASTPTSLSYTHPYLLLTHPDNTMTLFLVSSTKEELQITPGTRLWGHTSAVSGVHVESRGKAVSVSLRGDELRIWQLEQTARGNHAPRWWEHGKSIRVKAKDEEGQIMKTQIPSDHVIQRQKDVKLIPWYSQGVLPEVLENGVNRQIAQDEHVRSWVGLDEEAVVVLKERLVGQQCLRVYDFS